MQSDDNLFFIVVIKCLFWPLAFEWTQENQLPAKRTYESKSHCSLIVLVGLQSAAAPVRGVAAAGEAASGRSLSAERFGATFFSE